MLWQEDNAETFKVPDDIIDLVFDLVCRELPVDHIQALSDGLREALPLIDEDERFAIHEIHVAGSQNGWNRPDPALGQRLQLSRRTKLTLRVPREHAEHVQETLHGHELTIEDCSLTIGKARTRPLSKQGTIFARHIMLEPGEEEDENAFLERMIEQLRAQGIRVRKALSGITNSFETKDGTARTRSLMLAELSPEDAVQLQQQGLGDGRHLGCGIFVPHKGIEAVNKGEEQGG